MRLVYSAALYRVPPILLLDRDTVKGNQPSPDRAVMSNFTQR
jgi:hypothetical protein